MVCFERFSKTTEKTNLIPDNYKCGALVDDIPCKLAEALPVQIGAEDWPPEGSQVVRQAGGQEDLLEGGQGGG